MIFILFNLTAIVSFIFALKVKMWISNFTGFITIIVIMFSVVLYYIFQAFFPREVFENMHYLLLTILLSFISIRSPYLKYKIKCSINSEEDKKDA